MIYKQCKCGHAIPVEEKDFELNADQIFWLRFWKVLAVFLVSIGALLTAESVICSRYEKEKVEVLLKDPSIKVKILEPNKYHQNMEFTR